MGVVGLAENRANPATFELELGKKDNNILAIVTQIRKKIKIPRTAAIKTTTQTTRTTITITKQLSWVMTQLKLTWFSGFLNIFSSH